MPVTNDDDASPGASPAAGAARPVDPAKPQPALTELPAGGNIDKIRDIIFGGQMRDYEKRFARLEERLLKESSDLREDVKRRFEQLEGYTRRELDALAEQLKAEQSERAAADEALTRELRDLSRSTDRRVAQLDEQASKNARDLRQQMLDQARQLSDEIRQKFDELAASLDREAGELRSDKTDRAALAALFTEMAMRLNGELTLPGE